MNRTMKVLAVIATILVIFVSTMIASNIISVYGATVANQMYGPLKVSTYNTIRFVIGITSSTLILISSLYVWKKTS